MQHSSDEILALFDQWNEALQTNNPDNMLTLYSEKAILLPTLSNVVRHNHEEIRAYFVNFMKLKPVGTLKEVNPRVYGDIAINSGIYSFLLTQPDGSQEEVLVRYSFSYQYENNEWKIIDHHSSLFPEAQ